MSEQLEHQRSNFPGFFLGFNGHIVLCFTSVPVLVFLRSVWSTVAIELIMCQVVVPSASLLSFHVYLGHAGAKRTCKSCRRYHFCLIRNEVKILKAAAFHYANSPFKCRRRE